MPAPDAIFKPVVPGEAVATLVLIENSESMIPLWPDLQDHHLPTLLGTMRLANPIVPIQVLWLITSPVNDSDSPPSRNDKELPKIRFDHNPGNKISPAIVDRGINLLATAFKNQSAARHLILVAASSPSESYADPSNIGSKWQDLAKKLHEERIHLHLIFNPTQHTSLFSALFYNVLKRQGHQEVLPWFPVNSTRYRFHLAGTGLSSALPFKSAADTMTVPHAKMIDLPDHPPLLRNYTYPPDPVGSSHESDSTAQEDSTTPSLVTRLQKMHGLSKKKIYGSQLREPFICDAPRDKYSQTPTSLSIPPPLPFLPNMTQSTSADSRVPSKSKPERHRRLSAKSPLSINPPESVGSAASRNSWFRRNSRPNLPTDSSSGSYPSSPTSVSSYSANSPVLPTPHEVDCLAAGTANLVSAPWEPTWLRDQTEQYSSATTIHGDAAPFSSTYDQGTTSPVYSGYPLQAPSLPLSLTAQGHYTSTGASKLIAKSNVPIELPARSDDGDKPFILCPEYEAAAAARFQAIFQTPARKPNITPMNLYLDSGSVNHPSAYYTSLIARPPTKAPLADFSYADPQHAVPQPFIPQLIMGQSSSVPQTSGTSSLEGWDGQ